MATIRDIATKCQVSIGTVSRVINGADNVAPDLARKVHQCVREMGYHPSRAAQALRAGPYRGDATIGLVFCGMSTSWRDTNNPLFSQFFQGAARACDQNGYHLMVEMRPEPEARMVPRCLRSRHLSGVIVKTSSEDQSFLSDWDPPCPVVCISCGVGWQADQVSVDDEGATAFAIQHLMRCGHRRIAFINHAPGHVHFDKRVRAFGAFLQSRGLYDPTLQVELPIVSSHDSQPHNEEDLDMRAALEKLLEASPVPTAVITANNQAATGLYRACEQRSLQVGRDLSIVGAGDLAAVANRLQPALTRVTFSYDQISELAARRLFDRLEERTAAPLVPTTQLVSGTFEINDSVADLTRAGFGTPSGGIATVGERGESRRRPRGRAGSEREYEDLTQSSASTQAETSRSTGNQ